MRELGQYLKQMRESLGLDLDAVEAKTKIRKRYLVALEDGDWGILPGEVYARGFVRSYAECLGLDGMDLLAKFSSNLNGVKGSLPSQLNGFPTESKKTSSALVESNRSHPKLNWIEMDEVKTQEPQREQITKSEPQSRQLEKKRIIKNEPRKSKFYVPGGARIGQALIVVAIFVVLGASWWAVSRNNQAAVSGKLSNSTSSLNIVGIGINNSSSQTTTNTVTSSTYLSTSPANNTTSDSATSVTPGPIQTSNQTFTVVTPGNLSVSMSTVGEYCWVSVTADNKVIDGNDDVYPGQPKTWGAVQSLSIYLGHVQGVSLIINGKTVTLPQSNRPFTILIKKG